MSAHRRTRTIQVTALVVAIALAVGAWFLAHRETAAVESAEDAMASAEQRVPNLLSYDVETLEADVARAKDQTTGDFRDDYAEILDDVVVPNATKGRVVTTASVTAAGAVPGDDEDEVVVLVFLTQSTTTGNGAPTVSGSRVDVTMTRVDGDWLISNLKPV